LSVIEMHSKAWRAASEAATEVCPAAGANVIEPVEPSRLGSEDLCRATPGATPEVRRPQPLQSLELEASELRPSLLDIVIVPLAASAFAVKTTLRSVLRLLVNLLDWTFPIVMQGARVPLFLARIIGDVVAATSSGLVRLLPLSSTRRRTPSSAA
jgi:hypothetical protein